MDHTFMHHTVWYRHRQIEQIYVTRMKRWCATSHDGGDDDVVFSFLHQLFSTVTCIAILLIFSSQKIPSLFRSRCLAVLFGTPGCKGKWLGSNEEVAPPTVE